MRILLGLFLFLATFLPLTAQTAVTGNLKTVLGENLQSDAFVRFRLRNYSGYSPRWTGGSPGIITQVEKDVYPDSSGVISTNIYGNYPITPAGTFYTVEYWSEGVVKHSVNFAICVYTSNACSADVGTFNLNTATPLGTLPTITSPTGDGVYGRIDGGNHPFTLFRARVAQYTTYASEYSGADACAKILAALTALPAVGGTTVAHFESAQTCAASPFTGITKPVRVVFSGGHTLTVSTNFTVPATATVEFLDGALWSVASGVTVTWAGGLINDGNHQIFAALTTGGGGAGTGTVISTSTYISEVRPEWWGAAGDGTTDDAPEIQAAVKSRVGVVRFTKTYALSSGITLARAVLLAGDGNFAPGGVNAGVTSFPTLLKNFNGNLLTFDGSVCDLTFSSGGGVSNLRLVQNFGTAPSAAGVGIGIRLIGTSSTCKPSWVKIDNVLIEESGLDSWSWAIEVDGTGVGASGAVGIADIYITNVSTHTSGTGGATTAGAIKISNAQVSLNNVDAYINGHIYITGALNGAVNCTGVTNRCSANVKLYGVSGATLTLGFVNDVGVIGGIWSAMTVTSDACAGSGPIDLRPHYLSGTFTTTSNCPAGGLMKMKPLALGSVGAYVFESLNNQAYLGFSEGGTVRSLIGSQTTAGSLDFVVVDPDSPGTPRFSINTTGVANVDGADKLTVNSVIVPQEIEITCHAQPATEMVDQSCFVATQAYQVTKIRFVHAVAEATAANLRIQVTKDDGTEAPGAGDDLLTNNGNAGFDAKATANTVQTGTLTGTTAFLQLAAGNRLSLDFEAAATELVGVTITITLKRI